MLFLDNPNQPNFPLLLKFFCFRVPHGHVLAASRSPRRENMEHELLTAKVFYRLSNSVIQRREEKVRERFPNLELSGLSDHRYGRYTENREKDLC